MSFCACLLGGMCLSFCRESIRFCCRLAPIAADNKKAAVAASSVSLTGISRRRCTLPYFWREALNATSGINDTLPVVERMASRSKLRR